MLQLFVAKRNGNVYKTVSTMYTLHGALAEQSTCKAPGLRRKCQWQFPLAICR